MTVHKYRSSLLPLLLAALTVLAFLPVLQNGFVDWDDSAVLLANPNYRGLGWTQLGWMFTTFYMSLYRPLAWLTLGFDYRLWGMNAAGYHATSLSFHAANAVLVYAIAGQLYRLARRQDSTGETTRLQLAAASAALFFSLHPLTVEPIAWASARSDPVAAFFIFVSTLCYLRAAENAAPRQWLLASWAAYSLSLFSKATGVTFPIVLLALDFYPLRRLDGASGKWFGGAARPVWLEKVPFFALGLAAALISILSKEQGAAIYDYRLWTNLPQAAYAILFYFRKTVAPYHLSPIYPVPSAVEFWRWPVVACAIIVFGVTAALLVERKRWPAALASWTSFVAILLPVSGLIKYGPQLVADRYAYVPTAVCAVGLGALLLVARKTLPRRSVLVSAFATAILFVFATLTWRQTHIWRDSESLFRRAIAVAPRSVVAHHNLGAVLAAEGRLDEAIEQYRLALAVRAYPEAHFEWANALIRQGKTDEAEHQYREALKMDPSFAEGRNNLGLILASRGKIDEAIAEYREALKVKPDFALAHVNLGDALLQEGKTDEAIAHFNKALELDPNLASARQSLAKALGAIQRR
ncbi:MAG TPA: tetratricopeptide repeat protein [Verrucomicrobiae bacterium]|nr:tetratricopeptide repeat protein [Verrucomicrobiae bacterium]